MGLVQMSGKAIINGQQQVMPSRQVFALMVSCTILWQSMAGIGVVRQISPVKYVISEKSRYHQGLASLTQGLTGELRRLISRKGNESFLHNFDHLLITTSAIAYYNDKGGNRRDASVPDITDPDEFNKMYAFIGVDVDAGAPAADKKNPSQTPGLVDIPICKAEEVTNNWKKITAGANIDWPAFPCNRA